MVDLAGAALSRSGVGACSPARRPVRRSSVRDADFRRGSRRLLATIAAVLAPLVWEPPGRWPWWYTFLWVARDRVARVQPSHAPRRAQRVDRCRPRRGDARVGTRGARPRRRGDSRSPRAGAARPDGRRARASIRAPPRERLHAGISTGAASAIRDVRRRGGRLSGRAVGVAHGFGVRSRASRTARPSDADERRHATRCRVARRAGSRSLEAVPTDTARRARARDRRVARGGARRWCRAAQSLVRDRSVRASARVSTSIPKPSRRTRCVFARRAPRRHVDGEAWRREDASELHGDWNVTNGRRASRRRTSKSSLRPLDALVQRGALIVSARSRRRLPALARERHRRRRRAALDSRASSARGAEAIARELSVALFAFFVIPAIAFAAWSYGQLATDATQSRAVLVRETLARARSAAGRAVVACPPRATGSTRRCFCTATASCAKRAIRSTTRSRPIGRFLDPDAERALALRGEPIDTRLERVDRTSLLFGYRSFADRGSAGGRHRRAGARRRARARPSPSRPRRARAVRDGGRRARRALVERPRRATARAPDRQHCGRRRWRSRAACASRRSTARADGRVQSGVHARSDEWRRTSTRAARRSRKRSVARPRCCATSRAASSRSTTRGSSRSPIRAPRRCSVLRCAPGVPLRATTRPRRSRRACERFLADADDERDARARRSTGTQLRRDAHATRARAARSSRSTTSPSSRARSACSRGARWRARSRTRSRIRSRRFDSACSTCGARARDARVRLRPRARAATSTGSSSEIDRLDEIARAFSRYGAAPAERRPRRPIDVAAIVRDVVALERMGESERRVGRGGRRRPVRRDRQRATSCKEVLLNVLENARHAKARVSVCGSSDDRRRRCRRALTRARRRRGHSGRGAAAHLRAALLHAHERQRTGPRDQPPAGRRLGRHDRRGERAGIWCDGADPFEAGGQGKLLKGHGRLRGHGRHRSNGLGQRQGTADGNGGGNGKPITPCFSCCSALSVAFQFQFFVPIRCPMMLPGHERQNPPAQIEDQKLLTSDHATAQADGGIGSIATSVRSVTKRSARRAAAACCATRSASRLYPP